MEDFSIPKENVKSSVQNNIVNTRLNYEGSQFYGGAYRNVNVDIFKVKTADSNRFQLPFFFYITYCVGDELKEIIYNG